MFCEAYFIFSIGNIKPFFSYEYPACFSKHTECSANLTRGSDYSQIIGIICGMVTLGFVGDRIGRRHPFLCHASLPLHVQADTLRSNTLCENLGFLTACTCKQACQDTVFMSECVSALSSAAHSTAD